MSKLPSGPWTYNGLGQVIGADGRVVAFVSAGRMDNDDCEVPPSGVATAIGGLIAAAPEMLEALRGFLLGCQDELALIRLAGEDVVREARAALAKAEGRS